MHYGALSQHDNEPDDKLDLSTPTPTLPHTHARTRIPPVIHHMPTPATLCNSYIVHESFKGCPHHWSCLATMCIHPARDRPSHPTTLTLTLQPSTSHPHPPTLTLPPSPSPSPSPSHPHPNPARCLHFTTPPYLLVWDTVGVVIWHAHTAHKHEFLQACAAGR